MPGWMATQKSASFAILVTCDAAVEIDDVTYAVPGRWSHFYARVARITSVDDVSAALAERRPIEVVLAHDPELPYRLTYNDSAEFDDPDGIWTPLGS